LRETVESIQNIAVASVQRRGFVQGNVKLAEKVLSRRNAFFFWCEVYSG